MIELTMLPQDARELTKWDWAEIEPHYARLRAYDLNPANIAEWLAAWSDLSTLVDECYQRLYVATTQNTADPELEAAYNRFVEELYPPFQEAEQSLKQKLLAAGISTASFEIPLRNMRAEAALFRQENLPLRTQEQKLEQEYDRRLGSETVRWNGEEKTSGQMLRVLQDPDRATREKAWRLVSARRLENRAALNDLWVNMLQVRLQMAKNAGYILPDGTGDYRAYLWQQSQRFDYTPDDCKRFADAIEEVVVPAAARLYERSRQRLDVETLRPWDLQGPQGFFIAADPPGVPPLQPFRGEAEFVSKGAAIFDAVDPELGAYFETMRRENLLDLSNRKHKAPGAYCISYEHARRPFVFMQAVGTHEDVQTLLHESGHAFHAYAAFALPYMQQRAVPIEFCEVASMGMEFLGAPYFNQSGGYYNDADAARARIEKIETAIYFWGYMAVIDLFQHWVYENPRDALDVENCDEKWGELWERFMPGVDWSGLETERVTGWHRKPHIYTSPFYYIEYGMAQMGAVQIWANARRDQASAVRAYRRALALGGTATLPQLYETAGAKFKFDAETLRAAIDLMETTIETLKN